MNDHSLLDDLLRHKLTIVDRKLEELEALGEGERKIVSLCMAYTKRLEAANVKLTERVDSMMDALEKTSEHTEAMQHMQSKIDLLEATILELKTQRAADKKELDSFIQWAKSKGKQ